MDTKRQLLAHTAALHSRMLGAYGAGVPATGWGLREVLEYAGEFATLREQLRMTHAEAFSTLPDITYGGSIMSRNDLLRQLILDSHGVLIIASHFELWERPAPIVWPAAKSDSEDSPFVQAVRAHLIAIVVGLIVTIAGAFIAFRMGWV